MSTPSPGPSRPKDRCDFEIAIICALPLEADAIEALFDRYWDDDGSPFDKEPGDPNAYSTGVIGRHNVVLVHMPGMGKANAAAVAAKCHMSFPSIRLALVVGVCGVVPFRRNGDEIVLGDVVISDGIVQYDLGQRLPGQFVTKDTLLDALGRPNPEIRGVLAKLKTYRGQEDLTRKTIKFLDAMRCNPHLYATYPGSANDRLFEASYRHSEDQKSCDQAGCNGKLVSRRRLEMSGTHLTPAIHFGLMASGDSVMKSGEDRDKIAEAGDSIAFEMEGAGVWDNFPCIVIKGACDYADSHKSKVWQRYAAATAAACTKAFLSFWVPSFTQDIQGPATNFERRVSLQNQDYSGQSKAEPQGQPVFLVPFLKNDLFVGREDVLTRLRGLLFEQGRRKVALVGLGGIGKTQIALQLAFWVKENKQDYSVFWMPALSMAGFEQECMKLVKTLGIRCSEGEDAKDAVRQHLSSKDAGSWFLVVDNADDAEIFHKSTHTGGGILNFLPSSDNGRTLFTTRSKQVAIAAAKTAIEKLPQMHPEEAIDLLKRSLIDKDGLDDSESVSQLLDALTCLPLAIAQAAAYMNVYEISVAEYIRVFNDVDAENMTELLEQGFDDEVHYDSSQGAVATTWIVSFDRIRRTASAAADLLSFMAFIEPRGIPRSILPRLNTEQQMIQAIGTLTGHGFLSQRGREATFDMHSLVHLATRKWNEQQGLGVEMQQTTLARIADVFPTDKWENRDLWRQYLPHALRILETTGSAANEERCKLGYWVGRCLLVDGRTREAVSTLERVVAIQEKTTAEDHPGRLALQHELPRAYLADGQIKKAVEMLERVVAIREKIQAEDHPDRLASQHVLAQAYRDDNKNEKAVRLLEHVVAIRKKIQADDHPHRLISQHELAGAYLAHGQIKKAVEMLQHVVAIEEKTLAEDHPHRLASHHELARAYLAYGQIKKAVEMLQHVVAIRETILAEDHPSRLASQHELAGAYLVDGQIKKAVELLERVVAIQVKTQADNHPHRLASQHELAGAYLDDGQIKKAVELLERVVAIKGNILAEDHLSRLASQHELARAYLADNQIKKAVEMLERVLAIKEKAQAEDHPSRLTSQHGLARAYLADNQIKKAVKMLEHVVAIQEKIQAEDHPDRLASQDLLQCCFERLEGASSVIGSEASVFDEQT